VDFPDYRVAATGRCCVDVMEQCARLGVGYSIHGPIVNWERDLLSEKRFVHIVVPGAAAGAD